MPRIARLVVPGYPHHITQRGNRRQTTFFVDEDYREYIDLMSEWCDRYGVAIWSYCLMPNHVHLVAVPESEEGMMKAIGESHRRYTRYINFRENWRGHLWQGRFASFVMDRNYLVSAVKYIELNPVMAKLVKRPEDWQWSSAAAHIQGIDDGLVKVKPLLKLCGNDWRKLLKTANSEEIVTNLRRHERTGRPLGNERFINHLEKKMQRTLKPQKPGPKPRTEVIK